MQYFTPKLTIASRRKWFMWPTRGQPVLPPTLGRPFIVYFLLRFHTWNYTLPPPSRSLSARQTIIHLGWHGVGKPARPKNCIAAKSSFKLVEFNIEKKKLNVDIWADQDNLAITHCWCYFSGSQQYSIRQCELLREC